jgi:hypothetical protein
VVLRSPRAAEPAGRPGPADQTKQRPMRRKTRE